VKREISIYRCVAKHVKNAFYLKLVNYSYVIMLAESYVEMNSPLLGRPIQFAAMVYGTKLHYVILHGHH
jgi:hypothetical protein